jgi:hypothetical protein
VTWSQFEDLLEKVVVVCMVLFLLTLLPFFMFLVGFGIYEILS